MQQLFSLFPCIFKQKLGQPLPQPPRHSSVGEGSKDEAQLQQTAGVLHRQMSALFIQDFIYSFASMHASSAKNSSENVCEIHKCFYFPLSKCFSEFVTEVHKQKRNIVHVFIGSRRLTFGLKL